MTGGAPKPRAEPVDPTFSASSSSLKIRFPFPFLEKPPSLRVAAGCATPPPPAL